MSSAQCDKTVTESDNMLFSAMTLNPQPLHIDFDFAAKSEWGKPLVNSLFTLGPDDRHFGPRHDTRHDHRQSRHVGDDVPGPVFHGDTLRVETEILSVRESESKPDRGIVEFEHRAFNQNGVAGRAEHSPGDDMKKAGLSHALAALCAGRPGKEAEKGVWRRRRRASSSTSRIRSRRITSLRRATSPAGFIRSSSHETTVRRSMSGSTISRPD